jgi:hypothetical protein
MPEGFKAEFVHEQFTKPIKILWNGRNITPRGYTRCFLKSREGVIVSEAIAWCRDIDQFNKQIGRDISIGRAVKRFHIGEPMQFLDKQKYVEVEGSRHA